MAFTSVPVKGTIKYSDGTSVKAGTVVFTLLRPVTNGETTRSTPFTFNIESDGDIPDGSLIYALNDPGTHPYIPDGYRVTVVVDGVTTEIERGRFVSNRTAGIDYGVIRLPFSAPSDSARVVIVTEEEYGDLTPDEDTVYVVTE